MVSQISGSFLLFVVSLMLGQLTEMIIMVIRYGNASREHLAEFCFAFSAARGPERR